MPTLRPNFSFEIANTYVTDSGENRILVNMKYTGSVEVNGEFVNNVVNVAEFNFGVGVEDTSTSNVEHLIYSATPQYFID
jgi:hypothetical protein